jgi:hypothetical protein
MAEESFSSSLSSEQSAGTSPLDPQLLPSHHSYLGSDLRDIRERIFFDEETVISLPVISLDSVIIFPTETIPLRISYPPLVSYLRTHSLSSVSPSGSDNPIPMVLAVLSKYFSSETNRYLVATIGTIVEATATKSEGEEAVIMARGRCRFRLLSRSQDPVYQIHLAKALILKEGLCSYSPTAARLHNSKYYSQAMNPYPYWVCLSTSRPLLPPPSVSVFVSQT